VKHFAFLAPFMHQEHNYR